MFYKNLFCMVHPQTGIECIENQHLKTGTARFNRCGIKLQFHRIEGKLLMLHNIKMKISKKKKLHKHTIQPLRNPPAADVWSWTLWPLSNACLHFLYRFGCRKKRVLCNCRWFKRNIIEGFFFWIESVNDYCATFDMISGWIFKFPQI